MVAAPDLRHLPVIRLSFLILQREIDTKYPGFPDKLISSKYLPLADRSRIAGSKTPLAHLLAEWGSKLPYRRAAEFLNEMRSNPCAGPRRGLTGCFRSAAPSSTVNWPISFVSGFLDFAKIRVRSSVPCDRRPQGLFRVPTKRPVKLVISGPSVKDSSCSARDTQ
jgi:hypothetical protein